MFINVVKIVIFLLCLFQFTCGNNTHCVLFISDLGPIAPSRFSVELDHIGRNELVHSDCALHCF